MFFGAPWSLPSIRWAEVIGALKQELNVPLGGRNFLQVYVVPAELNENDKVGYEKLQKAIHGELVLLEDKVLIEEILKEFQIRDFPKLYIFDENGDIISKTGIEDIVNNDIDKIKKIWG